MVLRMILGVADRHLTDVITQQTANVCHQAPGALFVAQLKSYLVDCAATKIGSRRVGTSWAKMGRRALALRTTRQPLGMVDVDVEGRAVSGSACDCLLPLLLRSDGLCVVPIITA